MRMDIFDVMYKERHASVDKNNRNQEKQCHIFRPAICLMFVIDQIPNKSNFCSHTNSRVFMRRKCDKFVNPNNLEQVLSEGT